MTPENSALDSECIQKGNRLPRGTLVKIGLHFAGYACRTRIPGSVRDQNPELALKCFDLPFERIHSVSPAAMQKNERSAAPELPVMNTDWTDARRVRRLAQFHERH